MHRHLSTDMHLFQLTPSRRATVTFLEDRVRVVISTHALTEGDGGMGTDELTQSISTHALTEGDVYNSLAINLFKISTHALTEGDVPITHPSFGTFVFQLTPSRRATYYYHG